MNEDYERYIASVTWGKKRDARLALDGYACRLCDEDGTRYRLQVHHRPSSYRRMPNESIQDDLITLCSRCHDLVTSAIRGDRYERQPLPTLTMIATVKIRTEEDSHGMANTEISIDIIGPADHAQRPDSRPAEQMVASDQKDFIQARQDRRGL